MQPDKFKEQMKKGSEVMEVFALKEKKEVRKWLAVETTTSLQEEKMLFEWVKLGFESGNDLIKQEAQK